jgi:hypothetical protein
MAPIGLSVPLVATVTAPLVRWPLSRYVVSRRTSHGR